MADGSTEQWRVGTESVKECEWERVREGEREGKRAEG